VANHVDELWQEYHRNGQPIAGVGHKKSDFAYHDIFSGASHVWIWRNRGGHKEVLLQKRADDKDVWPGCWDVSTAGHIDLSETPIDAAIREAKEEIDLDIDGEKLNFIFADQLQYGRPKYLETRFVFTYKTDDDFDITLGDGEVSATKWVDLDELKRIVANGDNIVPHGDIYYSQLFQQLELA
jgi:isopentenyldiphosphate isomerase